MIREFKIYLSSPVQDIPNDYYHQMHGFVSSLLGENKYKEQGNRYSYSMLNNGTLSEGKWSFNDMPTFNVRIGDKETFDNFKSNIIKGEAKLFGMEVVGIKEIYVSTDNSIFFINHDTPLRLSNKFERIFRKLTIDERKKAEEYILHNIKTQMDKFGLLMPKDTIVSIVREYQRRIVKTKGVYSNTRRFSLRVNASDEVKEFIMLHGIGRSTGFGFGYLY